MSKPSPTQFLTLAELCELLGISKAVYYKSVRRGVFPEPLRTSGKRLVFSSEVVGIHKHIMETRVGANGEPVIFTKRKKTAETPTTKPPATPNHANRIAALASLGLSVTPAQVEAALKELPGGAEAVSEPELVRNLFLHLRKPA